MQDSHGKVSVEAFELYFKFVSACYLEENVFQFMMWNVWDLHQVRAGGQVAGVGLGKVRKSHKSHKSHTIHALDTQDVGTRSDLHSGGMKPILH